MSNEQQQGAEQQKPASKRRSLAVLPDPQRLAQLEARAQQVSSKQDEGSAMSSQAQPNQTPQSTPSQTPAASLLSDEQRKAIEEEVVRTLKTIYDPEIPINIHELGLIYGVEVSPSGVVLITMTLTAPACPVAESLPLEVESKVQAIPAVTSASVNIVWDPPWDQNRMSEAARLALGLL